MTNVRSRFNDWMFKVLLFLVPFLFVPLLSVRVSAAITDASDNPVTVTAEFSDATGSDKTKITYDGSAHSGITLTFTANGSVLNPNKENDYDVLWVQTKVGESNPMSTPDFTSAGTLTGTITTKSGSTILKTAGQTETVNLTIEPKSLTDTSITVDPIADVTYDGTEKKPSVVVKDGATTLAQDTGSGGDYTVSYSNSTNVGTATATITGTGNYTGNIDKTFNITAKSLTDTSITVDPIADVIYDGTDKTPTITVTDNGKPLTGSDYEVKYYKEDSITPLTAGQIIDAQKIKVKISGIGNYTGDLDYEFTIVKKSLQDGSITVEPIADVTYDGTAKKPAVVVKDGTNVLTEDTHYTVSYESNTNVGTAKVTITGKDNCTGSKTVNFEIVPGSVTFENLSASSIVYGQTLSESEITGTAKDPAGNKVEGTFSFADPSFKPELADIANPKGFSQEVEVKFVSSDGNYEGTNNIQLEVQYWGKPILNSGIMNWVDSNDTTSVQVKGSGISWLKEDSDNSFTWYGIENPLNAAGEPVFEPGSRFWVRWLNRTDSDWDKYYGQIDDKYKNDVDSGKLWIFLTGVTAPDGTEYKDFLGKTANLYIQLGSDWDERDLSAMCILSEDDEKVQVSYVTSNSLTDCPVDGRLAKLGLTHFSVYGVYNSKSSESYLDDYLSDLAKGLDLGTSSTGSSSKETSSSGLSSLYKTTGDTHEENAYLIPMFLPILLFVLIYEKKRLNKIL